MEVQNTNYVSVSAKTASFSASSQTTKNDATVKNEVKASSAEVNATVYESSKTNKDVAEKVSYKPDKTKIAQMANEAKQKTEQLKTLVTKLLSKQGSTFEDAFSLLLDGKLNVDDKTRLQAQEDISEDGYYGVAKTSERILGFAKALSGGDPSKIGLLKDAVIKGFKSVENMWGKKDMPEITKQTYDAVMKGFDDWEKGIDGNKNNDSSETIEETIKA